MTLNNFIRSVANFPDGAPCAPESFCVKGECQKLGCEGRALVSDARDCPASLPSSRFAASARTWPNSLSAYTCPYHSYPSGFVSQLIILGEPNEFP